MHTLEELRAHLADVKSRMQEMDGEAVGRVFTSEEQSEFDALKEERSTTESTITHLEERTAYVEEMSASTENRDEPTTFQVRRSGVARGDDIYDLSTIRSSVADPSEATRELRDRAMRSVEAASFPTQVEHERAQAHIARLLDTIDGEGEGKVAGELARRILVTGSPSYKRAFGKTIAGRPLTSEETRALSLGTGSAGGFSVVYTLDPTIVPTSNFSVNPFRAMARVETLAGTNEWKAVTSGAITAAYSAEATESSDNAPTLAQPDIIAEKAQAFVPFSIELGQDWGALQSEMASLLQDAKDDLEATKFAVGAGHGSNEPKGIITGATATTTAGGTGAFAIADLSKVLEALPPRYRPRAQWAMNLFTANKIRQFDTAGGSGVWIDNDGVGSVRGLGPQADAGAAGTITSTAMPKLLGRPVWESTAMAAALTTGSKILVIGDWRYFVIVDRVGMDIEILPHLLGANRRPTGQRGLYAYWRNSSDVLSAAAFQVLVTG
jgi:HK97 family phage major capsid protein